MKKSHVSDTSMDPLTAQRTSFEIALYRLEVSSVFLFLSFLIRTRRQEVNYSRYTQKIDYPFGSLSLEYLDNNR